MRAFRRGYAKPVKSLSGGERAKLALCIAESEKGNFLLFDEPTNHLDLPARESLEKALQSFGGTLLFVSHDRYFISAVARKIVEIEDGKLIVYDGGYEFYAEEKRRKREQAQAEEERLKKSCARRREEKFLPFQKGAGGGRAQERRGKKARTKNLRSRRRRGKTERRAFRPRYRRRL